MPRRHPPTSVTIEPLEPRRLLSARPTPPGELGVSVWFGADGSVISAEAEQGGAAPPASADGATPVPAGDWSVFSPGSAASTPPGPTVRPTSTVRPAAAPFKLPASAAGPTAPSVADVAGVAGPEREEPASVPPSAALRTAGSTSDLRRYATPAATPRPAEGDGLRTRIDTAPAGRSEPLRPVPPRASAVAFGTLVALDRNAWTTARDRTAELVNRLIDPSGGGRTDALAADRPGLAGHRADGWSTRRPGVDAAADRAADRIGGASQSALPPWLAAVGARVRPHAQTLLLLGTVALFASALAAWATGRGVGAVGDSVEYLSAARSLLAGDGLRALDYAGGTAPLTRFPPGYPLALAAAGWLRGSDPQAAARLLHTAAFGGTALLAGLMAWRMTRSAVAGALAAAAVATCRPLVELSTLLLSETVFNFLTLLALTLGAAAVARRRKGIDRPAWAWLIAAGLAAGAAGLTRFAGVGVVLAIAAVVAATWGRGSGGWRGRIAAIGGFLAATILPAVAWMLWEGPAGAAPRVLGFHPPDWQRLWQGVRGVGEFLPPGSAWGWATAAALAAILLPTMLYGRRRRWTARASVAVPAAFLGVYPAFLLVAITVADANVPLNARLLSPLAAPAAVVLICIVWAGTRKSVRRRRVAGAALAGVALAAGWNSAGWARLAHTAGTGYATAAWDRSATLAALADAPPGLRIYSNGPDLIYARLGRPARMLPTVHHRASAAPEPAAAAWIDAMGADLLRTGGWLVWFDRIDRTDFLPTRADVAARLDLVPARRRQPRDGQIWQVAKVRGAPPK